MFIVVIVVIQSIDYMNELQLSYSSIKDFQELSLLDWYDKWINKNFPVVIKKAFTLGSLLDCIFFEPELLDQRFIIINELPTESVCDFVTGIYQLTVEQKPAQLADVSELILAQIQEKKYWPNRKDATNLAHILAKGSVYFSLLTTTSKLIVSQQDIDFCYRAKQNALADPEIRQYLIQDDFTRLEFQKKIKADYSVDDKSVKLKCIFDICYTNEFEKTKQIIDLKSTASSYDFPASVLKYKYSSQVGLYNYALFRNEESQGYTIKPPVNIVVDKRTEQVSLYHYSWDQLKQERWGNEFTTGWHYIIKEIKQRYDTNNWV